MRRTALAVVAAAVVAVPLLSTDYGVYLANTLLVSGVLAIGLDILLGLAGQFAFAHIAFFGIGVYATGLLTNRFSLTFPLPLLVGATLATGVALLIAIPALRLRQVYLALTTYAFAAVAQWVFHSWDAVTSGANGLRMSPTVLFRWHLIDDRDAYPLLVVIGLVMVGARALLENSRLGLAMKAVHESEPVALASGIDARRTKIVAFGISGCYAGIAGGMLPLFTSYIHPDTLGLETLVGILTMVVVGGLGSTWGVLAGVVVMGLLPELLRDLQVLRELVYGAVLMLAVMFMPRGIAGLAHRSAS
ncbi:MAG TPA: branched-chain amino acid ABC transporter permease [Acetobacteraceae bacterium]|nr:branched-chain amino acid ABC transporter permease [Acetobacteraceae bacterium]